MIDPTRIENNEPETKLFRTFIYGSLRRGQFNNTRFKGFSDGFKCEGFIRGAQLKSLGPYPCIVPSDNPEDVVYGEIFDVPEKLHEVILRMEEGAGYEYRSVNVEVEANKDEQPGKTVPIEAKAYFFTRPERIVHIEPIKGGDWVKA